MNTFPIRGAAHAPIFLTLLATAAAAAQVPAATGARVSLAERLAPAAGKAPTQQVLSTAPVTASPVRPAIADDATQSAPVPDWESAPDAVKAAVSQDLEGVRFDEPGDGALWARTPAYKARFDGAGATIIPWFGSAAPRNFPVSFQAEQATLGGSALVARQDGRVKRDGDTVRIDHGSFVAEYELAEDSLEQRFVFRELPGSGELVLRLAVDTELEASDRGATMRFENELGHVDYGEAFALDARGTKIGLESRLVGGAVELVVPSAFVTSAALPLVIDPFVTFFTVSGGTREELLPDVSYDATTDRWCAVWADIWSATDWDVYAKVMSSTGGNLGLLDIDFTTLVWTTPKVANNNGADNFLVACAVVPASGVAEIRGRFVQAAAVTMGLQFQISPQDGAYRNWPDIGGDPYPSTTSNFCVVWQKSVSSFNVDIEARFIAPDGTLGGIVPVENSIEWFEHPYVSNSCGLVVSGTTEAYTITCQRRWNESDRDIYVAQLGWSGAVVTPLTQVSTSNWNETEAMASTILDLGVPGVGRTYMVVYQRDYGSDHDVIGLVLRGGTIVTEVNLVGTFDPSVFYYDQVIPTVDSDGSQFLVGHVERNTPTSETNVWISSFYTSGDTLQACAVRENFAGSPVNETDLALCSKGSAAGPRKRFFGVWTFASLNNAGDIQGGLWDACGGGVAQNFCGGDGSSGACPCGNNGASGNGCASSVNPAGANLSASGDASVSADTLVLHGSGMPASVYCTYYQGTTATAAAFGDGLRCAGGVVIRLASQMNVGGMSQYPAAGNLPIAVRGNVPAVGATRTYQAWYRNAAAFCTASTFNLSNGLRVIWAP